MDFQSKRTLGTFRLAILVVFSIAFVHGGHVIYEGNSTVNEGDQFTISCFLTLFDPVQWEKDGKPISSQTGSTSVYSFHEESVDGKVMASLVVKAASPRHSGSYRCNTLTNESHHITVISDNNLIANTDYKNYKVLNYAEPLFLECNTTSTPEPGLVMKWFKNDKLLQTSGGEKPNVVVKDNKVTIHRAMEDDVANYSCRLINTSNNSVHSKTDIVVVGRPYVKLPETVTVVEEEKLKLECTVIGSHNPVVEWNIGNKSYQNSEGRVKLMNDTVRGVINAIMELEPAQMSDRGEITCTADNIATTIQEPKKATIYVRVKDKYAALWPFLGICAEVIVLCTVIFIYEKKRNKTELDESDTDQSPEQKNTPDHGKDSVRHRK